MPDSSAIDAGLVSKLLASTALMALAADGLFWALAKQGATRFLVVDLLDHNDEAVLGGRAIESSLYLVKYVKRQDSASGYSNIESAQAARLIDLALEDQPIVAAGFNWMTCYREERLHMVEADPDDASIKWVHWGGHYRLEFSIVGM